MDQLRVDGESAHCAIFISTAHWGVNGVRVGGKFMFFFAPLAVALTQVKPVV